MTEVDSFLAQLDTADDALREQLWTSAAIRLPNEVILGVVESHRPCARWVVLRGDAGPTGRALPSVAEARSRVQEGQGSAADAYVAVMSGPVIDEAKEAFTLIRGAWSAARREPTLWLGPWLACRLILASFIVGRPERAWKVWDEIPEDLRQHAEFERLVVIMPTRGDPTLERSPWLQVAVSWMWRMLRVPAVPLMAAPDSPEGAPLEAPPFEKLAAVGATAASRLLQNFIKVVERSQSAPAVDDDPLAQELLRRAQRGEGPPQVDALPSWFKEWARAQGRSRRHAVAYLAGQLLHTHGDADRSLITVLVLPLARASDLPILRAGLAQDLSEALVELEQAAARLGPGLGDALVAASLPHHVHALGATMALAKVLHSLDTIEARPGGILDATFQMLRGITADRARDHAEAQPAFDALISAVAGAVTRLGDPKLLGVSDIERAVARFNAPAVSFGLLELAQEVNLPPLGRLVQALVLLRAIADTPHVVIWGPALRWDASQALFHLGVIRLLALRIQLLDELILDPGPEMSLAQLHFQRANSRRPLGGSSHEIEFDLYAAIRIATAIGEHESLADAVTSLANMIAVESDDADVIANHVVLVEGALQHELPSERRAMLLAAKAGLVRITNPKQAAALAEQAMGLLRPDDPYRWEIGTIRVAMLVDALALDEARALCEGLVAEVTSSADDTVLSMVHHAYGYTLEAMTELQRARVEYERALERSHAGGSAIPVESRLRLVRLAVILGDHALFRQHHGALHERAATLRPRERQFLGSLVATAAKRGIISREEAYAALGDDLDHKEPWEQAAATLTFIQVALERGETLPIATALRAALQHAKHQQVRALIFELAHDHGGELDDELLLDVIGLARRFSQPATEARLLEHLGRPAEAREVIDRALGSDLPPDSRLACLQRLITMMSDDEPAEWLKRCMDLEEALSEQDAPQARINLAVCYRHLAQGDPALLERAWRHGLRALSGLWTEHERAHAHRAIARVVLDLVKVAAKSPTEEVIQRAQWLIDDHPIAEPELTQLRGEVATLLLFLGPICLPAAVEVSEALVVRVAESSPASPPLLNLQRRLAWIRDVTSPSPQAHSYFDDLRGPVDNLPMWLVRLVAGVEISVRPVDVEADLGLVPMVLQLRPDAADRVLAQLVRLHASLSPATVDELAWMMHQYVSGRNVGPGAWVELEAALASTRQEERPWWVIRCEEDIQRARDGMARPTQVQRLPRADTEAYAIDTFDHAVGLMREVHQSPLAPESSALIAEARALLAEAVDIGERQGLPQLPDWLISLANAWKMPPDEDIERALGLYERVYRLNLGGERLAKLQKVHGDALRLRGAAEDLRRASALLERSVQARSGWLRAESLLSAANVALLHPDLDEELRIIRAAEMLLDAVRADAQHVAGALPDLLGLLAEWAKRRPKDERPVTFCAELGRRYPQRAREIHLAVRRARDEEFEIIAAAISNPSMRLYLRLLVRLESPASMDIERQDAANRFGPAAATAMDTFSEGGSLFGDPERVAAALSELDEHGDDPETRPGVLLARVLLLADLCRAGRRELVDVRAASALARTEHEGITDPVFAAFLNREHARIWCPNDHSSDPVCDFALGAELVHLALVREGGEEKARPATLGGLARALRYSPSGDMARNLAEARRLYTLLVERLREEGDLDTLANALHCLADVELQCADGDRLSRVRAGVARIEEAARLATNPYKRAEFTSSLAWERTLLALELTGKERIDALQEALATFDEVDLAHLEEPHELRHHRHHRASCLGSLERATKGPAAEVAVWRAQLEEASAHGPPPYVALAQHNLANALILGERVSAEEFVEALTLCERAVGVRTLETNARHHWETTLLAGETLGRVLAAKQDGSTHPLPWSDRLVWEKALGWLKRAVVAARILGPGEELARTAGALVGLARTARSVRDGLEVAELGWAAMREAAPFMIFHAESAAREAMYALNTSFWLAQALAQEGLRVAVTGLAFVMEGKRAELVLQWLVRAFAPLRRPVQALLQRPPATGIGLWAEWQSALASRSPLHVVDILKQIRLDAPNFLADDQDLSATWGWLRAHPGAVAITVIMGAPLTMVVVLNVDTANRPRTRVLGVPCDAPPVDAAALWSSLTSLTKPDSPAANTYDIMAAWANDRIVRPVLRALAQPPTAVLWCPGQGLRYLAPRSLWGAIPVAMSAAPVLPDLSGGPPRGRATLVVLADPNTEPLSLGHAATDAARRLVTASRARGEVSALVSIGKQSGGDVYGVSTLPGPASPQNLLRRAREHDVFVIIAHGEAPSPEAAALLLVNEDGEVERLDLTALATHTGAFTGATVVLLSCESGRVGDAFHSPGGVAGALIAAGAKAVVAPLWPVRLDVAAEVAEAVILGLDAGVEPFEALAALRVSGRGGGPTLGPAPTLARQDQAADLQRLGFICWVG